MFAIPHTLDMLTRMSVIDVIPGFGYYMLL